MILAAVVMLAKVTSGGGDISGAANSGGRADPRGVTTVARVEHLGRPPSARS